MYVVKTLTRLVLTVVISTYNRILMLEEALASVVSQEFEGAVEVIVVDDNSQDGTSELLVSRKYPDVRLNSALVVTLREFSSQNSTYS